MRDYLYPFCFVQSCNNCPFSFVLSKLFSGNVRRTAIEVAAQLFVFNKFYTKLVKYRLGSLCITSSCTAAHSRTLKFVSEIYSRVTHQTAMMILLNLDIPILCFRLSLVLFSSTDCRSNSIWLVHWQADTTMLLTRVICYLRLFVFRRHTLQQICQSTFISLNCSFAADEICFQEFSLQKEKRKQSEKFGNFRQRQRGNRIIFHEYIANV